MRWGWGAPPSALFSFTPSLPPIQGIQGMSPPFRLPFSPRHSFPTLGGGEEKWAGAAAGEWWKERGEQAAGATGWKRGSQVKVRGHRSVYARILTLRGSVEQNPKNAGWGLEKEGSASGQRVETSLGYWYGWGVVSLWVMLREGPPPPVSCQSEGEQGCTHQPLRKGLYCRCWPGSQSCTCHRK